MAKIASPFSTFCFRRVYARLVCRARSGATYRVFPSPLPFRYHLSPLIVRQHGPPGSDLVR